ncbi:MAG: 30S ribosomal protein S6 [Polyangiaceae bacterium]|nr:30S ribosomal protein S6 [Polyangiaceae bacterium]MCE7892783.1 30S ribosomal protein S6 [Sorangiineae bacterium PRO1]MCL4749273.1 30S ribosomal protein S6 [Myxococcales bacterium]
MTETTTAGPRAREYETIYIMRPSVAKEAAEKVAGRIEEVVGREGGKLTQVETWGRRALAYPVAKQRRGVYVYVKYWGGGALVNELERNLRMLDDVIKYQTVQTGGETELASVAVDPDAVKFEAIEAPPEDEQEYSLERELGLVDSPDAPPLRDDSYDEEAEVLAAVGDEEDDK